MAGDWIKVEHSTLDKPEVLRTAEMLGQTRDAALGLFLRYFVWLDRNLSGSCPDVVRNVSAKSLDEVLMCPGFSACLQAIRWADFDEKHWTLRVINADRHNGTTAKSRALDSRRKSGQRRENVRDLSGSQPDKNRTREEKRREEVIPPISPTRKQAAKRRNRKLDGITFDEWVASCKAKGEERVPPDDPVRGYAADAGISDDFMRLAWVSFGRRYAGTDERYLDWRATFRKAIEGNWLKLWYAVEGGGYKLTTVGESLRRALATTAEKAASDA